MAHAREARSVLRRAIKKHCSPQLAVSSSRRFVSTAHKTQISNPDGELAELDNASSFATPPPNQQMTEAFRQARQDRSWNNRLPGNRYQYHPPKYDRGPLHPVQSVPSSDPTSREFVPGPFTYPRLKHTLDSTIAPDLLTLTYQHRPPGTPATTSEKGVLRGWDGSSPYHKNRPLRGPRGPGGDRLRLLERDITFNNIPEILSVTLSAFQPTAGANKEVLHTTRAVLQAISGQFTNVVRIKRPVVQWRIKKNDVAGAKVSIQGAAAYEFVDRLIHLVLPKIKDWQGVNSSTGDRSGNIAFGLKPEWMSFFPEIEYNYDMYPPKLIPGCDIFIHTTATSDRQARLLMQAIGLPFNGPATHR